MGKSKPRENPFPETEPCWYILRSNIGPHWKMSMTRRFAHLIGLLAVAIMVLPPEWCCILRGASPTRTASLTTCEINPSVELSTMACPGCCSLANRSQAGQTTDSLTTESGYQTLRPVSPVSKPSKTNFCPFCSTERGILPESDGFSLDFTLVVPFQGLNFSAWATPQPIVWEAIAARISTDRPLWLLHQSFLC